jgi:hypothetical protein
MDFRVIARLRVEKRLTDKTVLLNCLVCAQKRVHSIQGMEEKSVCAFNKRQSLSSAN